MVVVVMVWSLPLHFHSHSCIRFSLLHILDPSILILFLITFLPLPALFIPLMVMAVVEVIAIVTLIIVIIIIVIMRSRKYRRIIPISLHDCSERG